MQGIDIMYDGDEAGVKASEALKGIAEEMEMGVQIVKLADGQDPGNFNADQIKRLKKQLYGKWWRTDYWNGWIEKQEEKPKAKSTKADGCGIILY